MKNKLALLFVYHLTIGIAFANAQSWLWGKESKAGGGLENGRAICTDANGNVYVTGQFASQVTLGTYTLTNTGVKNVFIAKYDSSGNVLWATNSGGGAGSGANVRGEGICVDVNGNIFVTGCFDGPTITFGNYTLTNAGGTWAGGTCIDMFVVKYSPSGNVLWTKSAGGTYHDFANSISTDAGGNVFITGNYNSSSITFGTYIFTNSGGYDVFVVKYSPLGNVLWAKSAGGTISSEAGWSCATDASGNIIATGFFQSSSITFGTTTLTNADNTGNTSDIFIVKYDASGNVLWAKSMGGANDDGGFGISADPNGNVFVTGNFKSPAVAFGSTILSNASMGDSADIFIVKYDAAGNVLWAKRAGGSQDDGGRAISTDSFGNAYITGVFYSSSLSFGSINISPPSGNINNPVFIVKYDPIGNVLCGSALASGFGLFHFLGNENAVSADNFGNAYITGGFTVNPFVVGTDTLMLSSQENIFVAKFTCCPPGLYANITGTSVLCLGQNETLTASGGGTYLWNTGATTSTIAITPTSTTIYSVTTSNAPGCFAIANQIISVDPYPPIAVITGNPIICSGQSTTLYVSGGGTYSWSNGSITNSIVISPTITTTYSVSASNACGSSSTSSTVTVNQLPTATAWNNVTILQGHSANLYASGGGSYLWSDGQNNASVVVSPMATTDYCVTVIGGNGCEDTACVTVFVEPCGELYLPNAFSPDNDGENDFLQVYYKDIICVKSLHIIIYNRWGEKVFETNDPAFKWNGTYHDSKENPAVLTYYLEAALVTGEQITQKGNISLIK